MDNERRVSELEVAAELVSERGGIVAPNRKAAASFRSRRAKGGDDHITIRHERSTQRFDIALTVFALREKMKDRSAVPQRVAPRGLQQGHVLLQRAYP